MIPFVLSVIGVVVMVGTDFIEEVAKLAPNNFEDIENLDIVPSFSVPGILMVLVGFLIVMYLGLSYTFVFLMAHFKNLSPWQSLEASRKLVSKHFGHFIMFILFTILVNLAGALLLGIGLLITIPASYAAIYVAFDDLVGARPENDQENILDHLIDSGKL
jgi:hypothetical protein